ncbi:hypothetical protein PM082_017031 [Marasmius tenuissimus]|nr:hypothetical protein PM082_017031 [Marasmius tenuissimus]
MTIGNFDEHTSDNGLRALSDLPLFLGYVSGAFLQGLLVLQVFVYFFNFGKDRIYVKAFVLLVFTLEWVFTIIATILAIRSLVSFGRLTDLVIYIHSKWLPLLCGLVTLVVQVFYSYRIYLLSGWCSLPIVISLFSIAQWVVLNIAGFNSGGLVGLFPKAIVLSRDENPATVPIWLGLAAAADCLIAVTLIIYLRRASRSLCTPSARTRVARTMIICIEAGVITVMAALSELLFYLIFAKSLIHIIVFFMLSKLYSNGMMATLNVRLFMPSSKYEGCKDWQEEHAPSKDRDSEETEVVVIGPTCPGSRTMV